MNDDRGWRELQPGEMGETTNALFAAQPQSTGASVFGRVCGEVSIRANAQVKADKYTTGKTVDRQTAYSLLGIPLIDQ